MEKYLTMHSYVNSIFLLRYHNIIRYRVPNLTYTCILCVLSVLDILELDNYRNILVLQQFLEKYILTFYEQFPNRIYLSDIIYQSFPCFLQNNFNNSFSVLKKCHVLTFHKIYILLLNKKYIETYILICQVLIIILSAY